VIGLKKLNKNFKELNLKFFEKERVAFLTHLTPGILHQISQPITAIHGFARFMKKEITPDNPFFTPVTLMEEQSQYLKQMLENLTRVVDHREAAKENVNVNELIEESLKFVKDELKIRRIRLDIELTPGIPFICADRICLQQTFLNLIVNAMQVLSALQVQPEGILKIASSFNSPAREIEVSLAGQGVHWAVSLPCENSENTKIIPATDG